MTKTANHSAERDTVVMAILVAVTMISLGWLGFTFGGLEELAQVKSIGMFGYALLAFLLVYYMTHPRSDF